MWSLQLDLHPNAGVWIRTRRMTGCISFLNDDEFRYLLRSELLGDSPEPPADAPPGDDNAVADAAPGDDNAVAAEAEVARAESAHRRGPRSRSRSKSRGRGRGRARCPSTSSSPQTYDVQPSHVRCRMHAPIASCMSCFSNVLHLENFCARLPATGLAVQTYRWIRAMYNSARPNLQKNLSCMLD